MNVHRPLSEQDQIALFIATRGVTRCPTVFSAPTPQAALFEERPQIRAHEEARREAECAYHRRHRGRPISTLLSLPRLLAKVYVAITTETVSTPRDLAKSLGITVDSVRASVGALRRKGARIETVHLPDRQKGFRRWQ